MTFLERARELLNPEKTHWTEELEQRRNLTNSCWREILAVVERMRFEHTGHKDETDGVPCKGCDTLDALDKKAGEG